MTKLFKAMSIAILACCSIINASTVLARTVVDQPLTQKAQQELTPEKVLNKLRVGNQRFVNNISRKYDYDAIRESNAEGQFPMAVILSCLDSRSSPCITFSQPLGNIFVARVAGNVISQNILGSMEFATSIAGAKVIVVMGHTSCSAVQGACQGVGDGNLQVLLDKIKPAVEQANIQDKKLCTSDLAINVIAKKNAVRQAELIYQNSPTLKKLIDEKKVMLLAAMHDLATGKVDFFYQHK